MKKATITISIEVYGSQKELEALTSNTGNMIEFVESFRNVTDMPARFEGRIHTGEVETPAEEMYLTADGEIRIPDGE